MLHNLFGEIPLLSVAVLLGLAAMWLCSVLLGLWASRAQRRWPARIGISASLVIFCLAAWLYASTLARFLMEAIWCLFYPANRYYYFAPETDFAACAVILAASNVVGIAGIWVSLGRPHWFIRALAITAIPTLLLLVRAYEPCFVFLVQSVVTIVPLVIVRHIRGWEPFGRPNTLPARRVDYARFQFGILDLLALTLIAATLLGIAVSTPEEIVVYQARSCFSIIYASPPSHLLMGGLGVVLGLVVLLAAWVTLSRGATWLRVMGFVLAWPGLLCMLSLALWREASGRHFGALPGSAAAGPDSDFASPQRRAFGRVGLILLLLLTLAPFGVIYYHLAFPPPIPEVTIPKPNGYDDLREAADTMQKTFRDQGTTLPALWSEASQAEVIVFRVSNRRIWYTTLQEVHSALDRPSQVPIRYRAIEDGWHESLDDLASALRIEGKAAASEGRIDDAIHCFADIVRLGRAAGRGGLLIDWLAESAIERAGVEQFHNLTRTLDAARCRMAIRALAAEDKDREPFEDLWQRERVWGARALGWSGRLYLLIGQDRQRMRQNCETSSKYARAELRIAMTELAIRAYSQDHGAPPTRLSQLVPDYLPAMLVDPLTDQPPVYELNEQGYVVFSQEIKVGWAAPPQSDQ